MKKIKIRTYPKTPLARLKALTKNAEAPALLLHWFDACFDSTEQVQGRELPDDYRAGCLDVVCGYYLGIHDDCVIMAHSAYVREGQQTSYRHVWNIPVSLVVKVEVLSSIGEAK